jgi:ubiquinone/menaquinone biosynthesis C-methylase UbiE
MSVCDVYGMTDKLSNDVLDVIVTRLEARGKHPFFTKVLNEYLAEMNLTSANSVLDMGCGTGVATRAIARYPGFTGKVTGTDLSPYLTRAATSLAEDEGLSSCTEFLTGDSQELDILDGAFDAVVLHTLISHVTEPFAVIQEAARIVKPGGLIGIFDGDYATITFGHEDPEKGKAYDEMIIKAIITNPRIMREIPRLLPEAGLDLVASFPHALADIGKADFFEPAIESFRKLLPNSGVMSDEEANAWADKQVIDSENGIFFGATNFYSYVTRRQ